MPDLRIRNLSKTYPNGVKALQNINLSIPKGMYGLLGPNGAEKDELRKTLGYLPQELGVYPKVTAERLLHHFAVLRGITRRGERKDVVESLLRQTNLWVPPDLEDVYFSTMTGHA